MTMLKRVELRDSIPHPKVKPTDAVFALCYEAPEYEIEDLGACVRITKGGVSMRVYSSVVKSSLEMPPPEPPPTVPEHLDHIAAPPERGEGPASAPARGRTSSSSRR